MQGAALYARMHEIAQKLADQSEQRVDVQSRDGSGSIDFEVEMQPQSPSAAHIRWMSFTDSFLVVVSEGHLWQSQHYVPFMTDEDEQTKAGLGWSSSLVERIARHGASWIALGPSMFGPLRPKRLVVNDELPSRRYTVLDNWSSW